MRQNSAAWLLVLYFFSPAIVEHPSFFSLARFVRMGIAQILLCQIKGIKITRQSEKRLISSLTLEERLTLLVFWLKWLQAIESSPSINAVRLDLWLISLIYHLKLGLYQTSDAFQEFLLGSWVDPGNATADAYLGLFTRRPVFVSHQNGDHINSNGFTLVGQANPNRIVLCKIASSLNVLGGLVPIAEKENLLVTEVQTDEDGRFEVHFPASLKKSSGTRYIVFVIANDDLEMTTGTQMTLIQE